MHRSNIVIDESALFLEDTHLRQIVDALFNRFLMATSNGYNLR